MNIYLFIYVDSKGKEIQRLTKRRLFKIGEINGLGWKLIDVKVLHNKKFISYQTYNNLRDSYYLKIHTKRKYKFFSNLFR